MQSSIAEDDSVIDGIQKSLFHIVEDKNKAAGKRDSVHRVVFAMRLNTSSQPLQSLFPGLSVEYSKHTLKSLLGLHYDPDANGFLKHATAGPEEVTGLLLMYPSSALHIIEGTTHVIRKVVEELNDFTTREVSPILRAVILNISHNINHRLFSFWSHAILEVEPVNIDLFETTESDENLISSIMTQLIKLGVHLKKDPTKGKMSEIMKKVREDRQELVPAQAAVGYLAQNCDNSCLIHCSEFLEIYKRPFDVKLASDYVWPLFSNMFSYTES
ncbi:hypothetical protein BOX15_Mlig003582g1 [Macrostomum lignano]|uniref:BLUF domain-containing protein n=1 Tax=Macrostomum lignano TaxID=282301 RepID=A0A267GKH3_9PLAT|nr:hypothetical protein BOX15_Mlig023737g2 [Macrostomum lignano]PAA85904.1 hypothetical protein BOX15_Mlig003582g1 [Macrostomum lignano]